MCEVLCLEKVVDCWTILVLSGRGDNYIWAFYLDHYQCQIYCYTFVLLDFLRPAHPLPLFSFSIYNNYSTDHFYTLVLKLYNVIFKYNMKGLPGMIYYNIKTCCINWSQHKMMQLTDHLLFLSNYITNKVLCYYTMYDVTRGSCPSVFIIYIYGWFTSKYFVFRQKAKNNSSTSGTFVNKCEKLKLWLCISLCEHVARN